MSLRRTIYSYLELSGDIQRPFVIIMSLFLCVELAEVLKGQNSLYEVNIIP